MCVRDFNGQIGNNLRSVSHHQEQPTVAEDKSYSIWRRKYTEGEYHTNYRNHPILSRN